MRQHRLKNKHSPKMCFTRKWEICQSS